MKACCVTGHRDIPKDGTAFVMAALQEEVEQAIEDGFTLFISGFAPGADMLFAELVVKLQQDNPQIHLQAALPYGEWFRNRSTEDQAILSRCVSVGVHSEKTNRSCYLIRNRFMTLPCERVIAVYDGRETGGTVKTMRFAAALGREMRIIRVTSPRSGYPPLCSAGAGA